jgi:hypothetical protein
MGSSRTPSKLGIGSYGRDIMDPLRSRMVHLRYVQVVGLKMYGLDRWQTEKLQLVTVRSRRQGGLIYTTCGGAVASKNRTQHTTKGLLFLEPQGKCLVHNKDSLSSNKARWHVGTLLERISEMQHTNTPTPGG